MKHTYKINVKFLKSKIDIVFLFDQNGSICPTTWTYHSKFIANILII